MTCILALDSATSACSVAVLQDGEIKAHSYEEMSRGQAEALIPMIADTMSTVGLAFEDLNAIGVTVGPGAFTGSGLGSLQHNLWRWRRVNPLSAPPRSKLYWLRKAKSRNLP